MAHAKLSPSAASRWMPCPGSVVLSAGLPDQSSDFAAEGTAAHELAERALRAVKFAKEFIGQSIQVEDRAFDVTPEMADYVQVYIDYVRLIAGTNQPFIEVKLPLESVTGEKDANGTADAVVIDGTTLHIIDLKYGMGVKVYAEENPQLMIYALAAMDHFDMLGPFTRVVLHIVQPRLDHIDSWEICDA